MPKQSFKDILEATKNKETEPKKDAPKTESPKSKSTSSSPTTKNGYDAFECMSALQKMVRRGKEAEALFWAQELESFNPSMLWKRLMVMSTEDVGIADTNIPILIKTLWDTYFKMKEMNNKQPENHIIGTAVLSLCRAKKSQEAMHSMMTVNWWRKYLDWRLEIPDVALDVHTRKGKKMGRGRNHWYSEGSRLFNKVTIDNDKWTTAFRLGDEIKYNLLEADDYYFHDHKGEYEHTEDDDVIDMETGLPKVGTYDESKVDK